MRPRAGKAAAGPQAGRVFARSGHGEWPDSFHVIGEILDRVFEQGSLTSAPLTNVQTTTLPAGGTTINSGH